MKKASEQGLKSEIRIGGAVTGYFSTGGARRATGPRW
jgi:hypothetical protein